MKSLRESYPIQIRKIFKKLLGSILFIIISTAILTMFFVVQMGIIGRGLDLSTLYIASALLCFLVSFSVLYEFFYFRSYYYASDDNNFQIRKGVVSKKEITLPYDRMTDIYVEQDIMDRFFGLYDLHFSTATAQSAMEAHIDGLNKQDCENLKKLILEKMNQFGRLPK